MNDPGKKRLAIVTSHPIQYNAPLFRLLAERSVISCKVFYTWGSKSEVRFDPGFGKSIAWDIPLLEGYDYEFLKNDATKPGSHHFAGIKNPEIISRINEFNPDSILVFGWAFQSHLRVLKYYHRKITVLFRGDSTLLDDSSSIKQKIRKLFLSNVYKHVDYALYVGSNNKDYFRKMGLPERQLVYAPHAIDNRRFASADNEYQVKADDILQSLDIRSEEIVFLFSGKLEKKKDIGLLIDAFKKGIYQQAHLLIVGNGDLEPELKKSAGGIKNIHFLDFQNQSRMPLIYRIGDIFVLPSQGPGETWGLSVNEAMASSRAVLVSDQCGCAVDLVDEGVNGWIFQSGNVEELRLKLQAFITIGKKGIREMGEASLKKIHAFSFDAVCGTIENLIQNNSFPHE